MLIDGQKYLLAEMESGFKIVECSALKDLVSYSPTSNLPVHRWFKYREGYSVSLIDHIIEERKERIVLDPFCGSGTTLLSSKLHKTKSIGIDINPLSTFISTVKTREYDAKDVEKISNEFKDLKKKGISREIEKPKLSILNKVFNSEILSALLELREKIKDIEVEKIRDLFFLAYLSILEQVSNTFKEGNGIKYKFTKRTKNGYIHIPQVEWENKNLPPDKVKFVYDAFENKIFEMLKDIGLLIANKTPTIVHNYDATKLSEVVDEKVSLCVFSPPYCNSFDYFEIFKVELWMGEFVKSYDELKEMRQKAIRSNANTDLSRDYKKIDDVEKIVELISSSKLWSGRVKDIVRGYFSDMALALQEIFKVLENNGRCIIIVGNSAYGGVLIPTDVLLARIGKEIGFNVDCLKIARHLTTSSQQKKELEPIKKYLRESLVCFYK